MNLTDKCELKKDVTIDADVHFQFYYFMYGRQIGTLSLAINDIIIWSLSDSQEDEWLLANVILPKGSYEVS